MQNNSIYCVKRIVPWRKKRRKVILVCVFTCLAVGLRSARIARQHLPVRLSLFFCITIRALTNRAEHDSVRREQYSEQQQSPSTPSHRGARARALTHFATASTVNSHSDNGNRAKENRKKKQLK